jgi:hypothetical protein
MKAIHVLRKPLSREAGSTVAANVLKYGCGGLNIDAARVETVSAGPGSTENGRDDALFGRGIVSRPAYDGSKGRWPANVVFQHLDGCKQTGVREIKAPGAKNSKQHTNSKDGLVFVFNSTPRSEVCHRNEDGTETVAAYDCEAGCPVAALDAQSGSLAPQGGQKRLDTGGKSFLGTGHGGAMDSTFYGDSGGASRFFKQF